MTVIDADLSLDPQRDAWLTPRESANWDAFALLNQFSLIGESDVAAVFGAASGGIAAWLLNDRQVANVIIVENRDEHDIALRRNFHGRTGVTICHDDPAASLGSIVTDVWPTVVVLDLEERTTDRDVVMALADDLPSIEILIVIFEPYDDRAEGLHNMILADEHRFISTYGEPAPLGWHRPDAKIAWYCRG